MYVKHLDLILINTGSFFANIVHLVQILLKGSTITSHVGIVIDGRYIEGFSPGLYLLESSIPAFDEPPDIRNKKSGILIRPLNIIIDYYKNKKYEIYHVPLKYDIYNYCDRDISDILFHYWKSNYQTSLFEMISSRWYTTHSKNIYCSQIVAIIYKRCGILKQDVNVCMLPDEVLKLPIYGEIKKL